jgi:rubrerythrin
VSRLPHAQDFLKTGFNAEAASAARFRAMAARAGREGKPRLAAALLALAAEKDSLALSQYEAVQSIREPHEALEAEIEAALAEERYENEQLYPRMWRDVDPETSAVFHAVVARQGEQAGELESLLDRLDRSTGDLPA